MTIYSMTATFGKLEHETLTLQPGLNIIEAPNEWGKSTWCAFLVAMLYGIETRVHSTKTALADKERYAPWSGSPMSGRIDLNWNGRDITIERSTKGRAIMGNFRAYETGSGLPIPELTAANCGQMLLGVERNVFMRAGFLRLTDLPVTQDDALRRRLNALVTTGDESGAADTLAQKLRDLKNKCRFNRSGLLPQAESQRALLNTKLQTLHDLQAQSRQIAERQAELESYQDQLANHRDALEYAASQENLRRVERAKQAAQAAADSLTQAETACRDLPSRDEAELAIQYISGLQQQAASVEAAQKALPQMPQPPHVPAHLSHTSPEQAVHQAQQDAAAYIACSKKPVILLILCALLLAAGTVLYALSVKIFPWVCLGAAVLCAAIFLAVTFIQRGRRKKLCAGYPTDDPQQWVAEARGYQSAQQDYLAQQAACAAAHAHHQAQADALIQEISDAAGGEPLDLALSRWQAVLSARSALDSCRQEHRRACTHAQALQEMAKPAQPPKQPDALTFTEAETNRMLSDTGFELRRLQLQLGQCLGQTEILGSEDALRLELQAVETRIAQLEDTYAALVLALQTLTAATAELQRRFAPQIAQRAQELFNQLTGGRYDRLTLDQDLSLHAAAEGEDVLHTAQWRSDGTADQLYLALRLAVAEALTPDAPVILDDALVRFDDKRLAAAMELLHQEAQRKQVILFTCQSREAKL